MTARATARALLSLTRAAGTSTAPVVAASTATTPWCLSRLITIWPPKTGTPSTTCSERTTEPPVVERLVRVTTARERTLSMPKVWP